MQNRGLSNSTSGIGNATTNKYSMYQGSRADATNAINFAYQKIDQLAQYARHKTDSWLNALGAMTIDEFCTFAGRNYVFRKRLMNLNDKEIAITLQSLGVDAAPHGDANAITNNRLKPSYAEKRNYIDNFQSEISSEERKGNYSTTNNLPNTSGNYENHGQLYRKETNLYYDENGSGIFTNKIVTSGDNLDSILGKTRKMFARNNTRTIISAFHTKDSSLNNNHEIGSKYGVSHGRNLLTKDAETKGGLYQVNGYNNPYCRVWTHHHQYSKYLHTMRDFYTDESENHDENTVSVTNHIDFNKWDNFKMGKDKDDKETYGWKSEGNDGWKHSVLNKEVATPNIAPSYNNGSHIHTKDCMFSIENLAWKGYSPYSFEEALSWEQRGPNGGRIMWFPPYGIQFNETTSANWDEHRFIGRGEPVYTYVNTARRGTLRFMMVVDHPSIVDYVTWSEENRDKVKDTDLLRFFAGCEDLRKYATPTPLTDEYLDSATDDIDAVLIEPEPETVPDEIPDGDVITVTFYVFFPNNYSGYFDRKSNSVVEPIAYLLAGTGAQKEENSNGSQLTKDIPLRWEDLENDNQMGSGYEMSEPLNANTTSTSDNYIIGTSPNWSAMNGRTEYVPDNTKKWYYRVDGEYKNATSEDVYRNTYDQRIINKSNNKDTQSYRLNSDVDKVCELFGIEGNSEETIDEVTQIYCSLAEFAALVADSDKKREIICHQGLLGMTTIENDEQSDIDETQEQPKFEEKIYDKIYHLLNDESYSIESARVVGYSNSHGSNANTNTNNKRNENLARERANTVIEWLKKVCKKFPSDVQSDIESAVDVGNADKSNASGENAKKWRSAKVDIMFKKTKSQTIAEGDKTKTKNGNIPNYEGFVYKDKILDTPVYTNVDDDKFPNRKGRLWYYDKGSGMMKLHNTSILLATDPSRTNTKLGLPTTNKLRYDQEYHFFKVLQKKDPAVFDRLMDKLQYFDPAFHSMTPEGFNGRLTFLQQCMRQGNTVGASDPNRKSASNLAFGRQPYCILRLGDFFNQMVVIKDLSIDYDPLVWDLNTEGIGVQPLICNVNLSFDFIGGADMAGSVKRLQNAMSFNYYANTSLYDNRADRVNPKWNDKTNGAITQGELDNEGNYFYNTTMYKS